jgi:hypothetical protein
MTLDTLFGRDLTKYFTRHPGETDVPQTYIEHGKFAIYNSSRLLMASFAGIVHGIFPEFFKFYTSSAIIISCKKLVDSGRHVNEFNKIMLGYINPKYLEAKVKKSEAYGMLAPPEELGEK